MFDDAVEHGVLSRYVLEQDVPSSRKMGYRLTDTAVRTELAAAYEEAPTGVVGKVVAFLAAGHKTRLMVDGIASFYIVIGQVLLTSGVLSGFNWADGFFMVAKESVLLPLLIALAAVFTLPGACSCIGIWLGTALATGAARWLAAGPTLTRRHRVLLVVAIVAAVGGVTALVSLARAVPAALVAACGLLVCVLIGHLVSRTRAGWRKNLVKPFVDIAAIATMSATVLVLSVNDLLTTQPAAGLLFPIAVWGSVRVWRAMRGSGRLPVRAAADIALSVLLGGELVVFLVWLGDVVGIPRSAMGVLRAVLERAGDIADLPWWVWTGLYVLLAGLYVAFVHWPGRLSTVIAQVRRWHVVPVTNTSRRVLTCVHIGLLVIVLVGLAAPVTVTVALQRQLAAMYAVAAQREFDAEGELLAYQQIRHQLSTGTGGSSQPLTSLIMAVEDDSTPISSSDDAASDERYVAQGLGQLQAATLQLTGSRLLQAAEQTAVREAGLDAPISDAADAAHRIEQVDAEQDEAEATTKTVEQAGDLAAAALASTVSIPALSELEVIQMGREYLSGLVEESPIKDVFADWTRHLVGATAPPDVELMVVPDADHLQRMALDDLSGPLDAGGDSATVAAAKTESPLDAAAKLINGTHVLQASSGDCSGCGSSGGAGGQDDDEVPGDQPIVIGDDGG